MAVFPFTPNARQPFQFSPTLDGNVYNVSVTSNLFGARNYINVYALDGTLALSTALVGSPTGVSIQAISWAHGRASATTITPHGYKVGRTVSLTITGCLPAAYNGQISALIIGPEKFSWPIADDPGPGTAFGAAIYNINLVGGLFSSLLVFREASRQFEVSP